MGRSFSGKVVLMILVGVSIIEFYAEFTHNHEVLFFTKPLLLPLIALGYFISVNGMWNKVHKLMMMTFLFSWFGDISLMLTPETITDTELMGIPKSKYFFLAGLSSFFVTQLLFVILFRKSVNTSNSTLSRFFYVPFVLYWICMLVIILPPLHANPEKSSATVPVIFYSAVLISMAAHALNRYGKTTNQSFWLTFVGAIVFVISDSLIAINFLAFPKPTHYAGFSIITTYIIAECFIAVGILLHPKS